MFNDRTTLEFPHSGTTEVDLLFDPQLIRCRAAGPGGRALHVLIDTGTDPSAVDAQLAQRLALPTGGQGLGRGAVSDALAFTEAELPWLRIGGLTIRNLFAPALDLSSLPFEVDIVLGYNVLRQVALRIDYSRQRLSLTHPDLGLPQPAHESIVLPLSFFEHFPALRDIDVNGQHIPLATVDTGSNAALSVGPDLAARLGLHIGAQGVVLRHGAGFGGESTVLQKHAGSVRIGSYVLSNVEIDAHLGEAGDLGRPGRANIGNRLLARFATIGLDYERGVIALEARSR